MIKVLILNNRLKPCGVQQWGGRIINALKNSKKFIFSYREVGSELEYLDNVITERPNIILYNYNPDTMSFVSQDIISRLKVIKHVAMVHEGYYHKTNYTGFEYIIYLINDIVIEPEFSNNVFSTPVRYLLPYSGNYPVNDVPTIGSFGFGFPRKRFDYIVEMVNREFDIASIRFCMASYSLGDNDNKLAEETIRRCHEKNTNPNISLNINREFITDDQVLEFLAGNDINCFFYDSEKSDGIAGSTDFALSVRRPIAITKVPMFSHIHSVVPSACIENSSLREIMSRGTKPLEPIYKKFSNNNFLKEFERILERISCQ